VRGCVCRHPGGDEGAEFAQLDSAGVYNVVRDEVQDALNELAANGERKVELL